MFKVREALVVVTNRPLDIILFLLSLTLLLTAGHMAGPWNDNPSSTSIVAILDDANIKLISGLVFAVPAVVALVGLLKKNRNLRYYGSFGIFMSFCFMTALSLIGFGFETGFWITRFTLALMAGVVSLVERDQHGLE